MLLEKLGFPHKIFLLAKKLANIFEYDQMMVKTGFFSHEEVT